MAENPEANADEVGRGDERSEAVPETIVDEVEAAATPDEGTAAEETATETGSRRERNAAARKAKAAKPAAGPRTLEDRIAERKAHRETNARQRTAYRAKQKVKRAQARAEAAGPDAGTVSEELHAPEHGPGRPKVRQGVVVSDKGDKTIVVRVDVARRHKRYQKILRSSTALHVHDERNDASAGDTVRVQECRPMSRMKRWRLVDILERAR
jgi:small subunit ribosomal protein S17